MKYFLCFDKETQEAFIMESKTIKKAKEDAILWGVTIEEIKRPRNW